MQEYFCNRQQNWTVRGYFLGSVSKQLLNNKMETRKKQSAENYIKDIRRKTRRIFSSEQKIQIIMEALRAESCTSSINWYSLKECLILI